MSGVHSPDAGVIYLGEKTFESLKKQNFENIKQRCQIAADANQKLLSKMKSTMFNDFEQWLENTFK